MVSSGAPLVDIMFDIRDDQVSTVLHRLQRDLDPNKIGLFLDETYDPWIRRRARDRFKNEGDDVSGRWLPLSKATWGWRAPQFPPQHPINVRTGRLRDYILNAPNRVDVQTLSTIMTVPGKFPTKANQLEQKVMTAQLGRTDPRTPKRPVMGVNERDLLALMTDLSLYLGVGQFQ